MKRFNQFQLKSLANFCFDLSKAWFVAGIIAPIGVASIQISGRIILLTAGILASWFLIKLGLSLGEEVKE